uniref:Protein kinase domain-containing protein n=1 Tax=Spumella elongata TaxID=89044 RepID=A0A7S3GNG2_9STRA
MMHSKVGNLPGVTRLFGANLTAEPRCIVLELADGSLHDALHKRASLSIDLTLPSKLSLAVQLCSAMTAISDMNLIHRDIKSSNVLIFVEKRRTYAKLADFGLAKMVNESTMSGGATPKGTPPYMAPELFRGEYKSASDMYAFAVLLNELLSELVPFPNCTYFEIMQSVGTFRKRPVAFAAEPSDTLGCELVHLIGRCWHQDPALRMSFHELAGELQHVLRKAVDAARVGNHHSPLTLPRPPTTQIEAAITELCGWLTVSCHFAEPDAMSLAHTLVTVKDIYTPITLSQVLHRSPAFLSEQMNQSTAVEARICTALGITNTPVIPVVRSGSSVRLDTLSTTQLCELFDHCSLPTKFSEFVVQNDLGGFHFEGALEIADDLVELGLNRFDARALFTRVSDWKQSGLPADFVPTAFLTPRSAKSPITLPTGLHTTATASITNTSLSREGITDPDKLDKAFYAALYLKDDRAAALIATTADRGDHLAEAYLAYIYSTDSASVCPLLPKNPDLALMYTRRALPWMQSNADSGDRYALSHLAVCYLNGRGITMNESLAVHYLKMAAEQGQRGAQLRLGKCYDEGTGVSKDVAMAAYYYKLAADQGHLYAEFNIAWCYENGCGVDKDVVKATHYYTLAADQGHIEARYMLGVYYGGGIGVTEDEAIAFRHYKLAADEGHKEAQFYTAVSYRFSQGVAQDKAAAVQYFKLAADQGHVESQVNLADYYADGDGVVKDEI